MAEKRKFIRLPMKMLVAWRREALSLGEAQKGLDIIRDISRAGISFISKSIFDSGEKLSLEIKLPSGVPIKAAGTVMRVNNLSLHDIESDIEYEIGVQMEHTSQQCKKDWDQFVFEQGSNIR